MPMYLVHGFRWPRRLIRIYIIMHNLDDAAAEYIVSPDTSEAMLSSFQEKFPQLMESLPKLRFVEQYDPSDTSAKALSQPYAFVVDQCKGFDLSLDVDEAIEEGICQGSGKVIDMALSKKAREREREKSAMDQLRKELAPEEKLGWWVVYNGDESRLLVDERVSRDEVCCELTIPCEISFADFCDSRKGTRGALGSS